MKKLIIIGILLTIPFLSLGADVFTAETAHYRILSTQSAQSAQDLGLRMESYYRLFNEVFRFIDSELPVKMNVRLFTSKNDFDTYLLRIVPQTRESFVYIQYKDPEKCELVLFLEQENISEEMLIHHGFIQYLKSFIPHPPLWMLKGFAQYFEKSQYSSETGDTIFKENLIWIRRLKDLARLETLGEGKLLSFEEIFILDTDSANLLSDVFHPQSWAAVHFLLSSEDSKYRRILWDSISSLRRDKSQLENSYIASDRTLPWYTKEFLQYDFLRHLESIRSFSDYLTLGVDAYKRGEREWAKTHFLNALTLDKENPIPFYYLGLIAYNSREFTTAEYYYTTSLNNGGNQGLCLYALGINAYSDKRYDDARSFLTQAMEWDPEAYSEKALEIIALIDESDLPEGAGNS